MRLDAAALHRLISATLASHGVETTWSELLAPALIHIGLKHEHTGEFVEVEHLLSAEVSRALAAAPRYSDNASVLLACTDEEQHTLALEALAAALAERGVASRLLGARVPPSSLRQAIRRIGPETVVLWSQTGPTAHLSQIDDVLMTRPAPKMLLLAGPGWGDLPAVDGDCLRAGVLRPTDLGSAVSMIIREPGASAGE